MPDKRLKFAGLKFSPLAAKQQRHPQTVVVMKRCGVLQLVPMRVAPAVQASPAPAQAAARPRERRERRHVARSTSSADPGDDDPPPRAVYAYGCLGRAERGESA